MSEPDFGMGHFAHDLPGIPLHGFDPGHYPDGANAIRLDSPQKRNSYGCFISQAQQYRGIPRQVSDPTCDLNDHLLPLGGHVIACVCGSELTMGRSTTKDCYRQLQSSVSALIRSVRRDDPDGSQELF